jgi:hypothetical protein
MLGFVGGGGENPWLPDYISIFGKSSALTIDSDTGKNKKYLSF